MPLWKTLGLLAVLLSLSACEDTLCGNEVLNETPAPGDRNRAIVFERDCGATTDFSTQVSILGKNQAARNEGGNVFVAGSKLSVSVRWTSPDHLVITYPAQAKVFLRQTKLGGVTVSYETTP
jgi:hypothetical protein